MSKKFKAGDVVVLKSGSPPMTVDVDEGDNGDVHVTWLDAYGRRNKPEEGFFAAVALVKYQPDDESET